MPYYKFSLPYENLALPICKFTLPDKKFLLFDTAMDSAAKVGYKVLVIDSLSHAWRELTEEVDRVAQSSTSKNTFSAWGRVAPKQKKLVDAILNYPGHLITTMRSKTEWVIGEGKSGKLAPEKMGLAPEQGKGIEYEFDLLVELNQAHQATVTKDRTGKFQDDVIEKPGEEFGVALYNWLSSGSAIAPVVTAPVTAAASVTPTDAAKPKATDKGGKTVNPLKGTVDKIIAEIGDIVKGELRPGAPSFTESEKNEVRAVITNPAAGRTGLLFSRRSCTQGCIPFFRPKAVRKQGVASVGMHPFGTNQSHLH